MRLEIFPSNFVNNDKINWAAQNRDGVFCLDSNWSMILPIGKCNTVARVPQFNHVYFGQSPIQHHHFEGLKTRISFLPVQLFSWEGKDGDERKGWEIWRVGGTPVTGGLFELILSTNSWAPSLLSWLKGLKSNQYRVCFFHRNTHWDPNTIYDICGSKNNNNNNHHPKPA